MTYESTRETRDASTQTKKNRSIRFVDLSSDDRRLDDEFKILKLKSKVNFACDAISSSFDEDSVFSLSSMKISHFGR